MGFLKINKFQVSKAKAYVISFAFHKAYTKFIDAFVDSQKNRYFSILQ